MTSQAPGEAHPEASPDDATRLTVGDREGGERLDRFVQSRRPDLSRTRCAALIKDGHITVDGAAAKPSTPVRAGETVRVVVPAPASTMLVAQAIPLTIVHDDPHYLVVDKPAGLTVHPGPGHPDRTLVNALLALVPDLLRRHSGHASTGPGQAFSGIGGEQRPGIVHRLDKDTSGLMIVAKTDAAHRSLTRQLKERRVAKTYVALVAGSLKRDEGEIDAPIARHPRHRQKMAVVPGGRDALTRYKVVRRFVGYTLVEAYPVTGRTHQIRVHFAYLGHPLVGDAVYGKASLLLPRHFLHAAKLAFHAPPDEREWVEFEAPLPEDLRRALALLSS